MNSIVRVESLLHAIMINTVQQFKEYKGHTCEETPEKLRITSKLAHLQNIPLTCG